MAKQNLELQAIREALEAEQTRYRDLFEFAPDGYLVTDCYGNIEAANRAAADLLGATPQTLVHKPLSLFIHSSELKAFRMALNRLDWPQN
jgi:two-component system cell cycle sensor histidine kinase/response regulator CckA